MILDKENYESRGIVKGLFRFIWMLCLPSKVFRPRVDEGRTKGIPILVLDSEQTLICQSCKECEKVCPTSAITVEGESGQGPREFSLDPLKCTSCMDCVRVCPTHALKPLGRSIGPLHTEGARPLNKDELSLLSQSAE